MSEPTRRWRNPTLTPGSAQDTRRPEYADRLESLSFVWWKRLLDVQAPFRWHVRRLRLGDVLDVGCGWGRNLLHNGGHGVGIDHNPLAVEQARARGLTAFSPRQFQDSSSCRPGRFDSLLLSHVLEHLHRADALALLEEYLPFVKPEGQVVVMTPQECGHRSDASHVEFVDFGSLAEIAAASRCRVQRAYSFPLPRPLGRVFRWNEFVSIWRRVS